MFKIIIKKISKIQFVQLLNIKNKFSESYKEKNGKKWK